MELLIVKCIYNFPCHLNEQIVLTIQQQNLLLVTIEMVTKNSKFVRIKIIICVKQYRCSQVSNSNHWHRKWAREREWVSMWERVEWVRLFHPLHSDRQEHEPDDLLTSFQVRTKSCCLKSICSSRPPFMFNTIYTISRDKCILVHLKAVAFLF